MHEHGSAAGDVFAGISPEAVRSFLLACTIALTALHLLAAWVHHGLGYDHALGFVPLFDLNLEANAPTWFSSALLLSAGITALLIASRTRLHRWHWMALGFVALLLSLDESAQIHELLSAALRSRLTLGGGFSWTIVAIVSVLPVLFGAALFYRFITDIPADTRRGLIAAGIVYVTGVVGVDTIAALAHDGSGGVILVTALNTVEEVLEMVGIVMLIHALLTHLLRHTGPAGLAAANRAEALSAPPRRPIAQPDRLS